MIFHGLIIGKFIKYRKTAIKGVVVTKESAARSQLETAIQLWFTGGDPISIHALAVASNDCYRALGAHKGNPSLIDQWLKSQSQATRKRATLVQNFIKHGRMDLKGSVRLTPIYSAILLFDSVACHFVLKGDVTPLMRCFFTRVCLENPTFVPGDPRGFLFEKGIQIYKRHDISRRDFLKVALPLCKAANRTRRKGPHIEKP